MLSINRLLLLICIAFPSCAKDRSADPFKTSYESTLSQGDLADQLNSLQVSARPLLGEPLLSGKSELQIMNDDFRKLVEVFSQDGFYLTNIQQIDSAKLQSGQAARGGWSYHAWPAYKAGLAYRYLDPSYQRSDLWQDLVHEYERAPPLLMIANEQTDLLSPIEKYEYLIGNMSFSLTDSQWKNGQRYMDAYGEIPTWIGICHGTAPAGLNAPRPWRAITLKSFDGQHDITFYPSDIKALTSYAWAVSGGPSAVLGARCENVMQSGLRATQNCLDTNPAAFHLAVINLMGLQGEAFIMDSFAGREVWNRTVLSYRYHYFRPGTRNQTDQLLHALLARKDYPNDPYAKFRSPRATHILGITVELTYLIGTVPSDEVSNHPQNDVTDKTTYRYDLELDKEGTVIGGEWHGLFHPDFLWAVAKDYRPKTIQDHVIGNSLASYSGKAPLPKSIALHGKEAANSHEVLYSVLDAMLRLSQESASPL